MIDHRLFSYYSREKFQTYSREDAQAQADGWNEYDQSEPDYKYTSVVSGKVRPRDVYFVAHSSEVESPIREAQGEGYVVIKCIGDSVQNRPLYTR